jgi:transposase
VRLSYTEEKPLLVPNGIKCAINLGMTCFLAAVVSSGERWLYDGHDIGAFLKQTQRRRRQYQNDSKASARWGHGRTRTLQPIEKLQGAAERWRETRNQTIARRFVEWLVAHNVTELIIGDFTGIRDALPEKLKGGKFVWDLIQEWPFFDLQTRIVSCAEEAGMRVTQRDVERASQTCTFCGHVDPLSVKLKQRIHHCTKCGEKKHVDVSHCEVLLQRDAAGVPSKPKKGKKKKFVKKEDAAADAGTKSENGHSDPEPEAT